MSCAKDLVEAEYERAIEDALYHGDNDEANWLSIGLREHRRHYKV